VPDPTGPTSRPNGPARPPPPRPSPARAPISFVPNLLYVRTYRHAGTHREQPPATSPTRSRPPSSVRGRPFKAPGLLSLLLLFSLSSAPPGCPDLSPEFAGAAPPPSARHGRLGPNPSKPLPPPDAPAQAARRPRFCQARRRQERRRRPPSEPPPASTSPPATSPPASAPRVRHVSSPFFFFYFFSKSANRSEPSML
jgi:hypothetical protein